MKSSSEGIVTKSPPAISSASLAISYGNLVTFCLHTFAKSISISYDPDAVECPSQEQAIPAQYRVSFKWSISIILSLICVALGIPL